MLPLGANIFRHGIYFHCNAVGTELNASATPDDRNQLNNHNLFRQTVNKISNSTRLGLLCDCLSFKWIWTVKSLKEEHNMSLVFGVVLLHLIKA